MLVVCWPAGLTQVTEMVSPGLNRARMLARLAREPPLHEGPFHAGCCLTSGTIWIALADSCHSGRPEH